MFCFHRHQTHMEHKVYMQGKYHIRFKNVKENKHSKNKNKAGEMAKWLRTLAIFAEDLVQFPTPTWWFTAISNSSYRASDPFF